MDFLTVFAVAVALGTDAFSLAVGLGVSGCLWRRALAFSLAVCFLHVSLPLAGLLLGRYLGQILGQVAGVLGAAVLLGIGGQLLWQGWRVPVVTIPWGSSSEAKRQTLAAGPLGTFGLAGSVSLDALTVGFGLGALRFDMLVAVSLMGLVAGLMAWTGFICGRRLGYLARERSRLVGGVILILIGVRLLVEVW